MTSRLILITLLVAGCAQGWGVGEVRHPDTTPTLPDVISAAPLITPEGALSFMRRRDGELHLAHLEADAWSVESVTLDDGPARSTWSPPLGFARTDGSAELLYVTSGPEGHTLRHIRRDAERAWRTAYAFPDATFFEVALRPDGQLQLLVTQGGDTLHTARFDPRAETWTAPKALRRYVVAGHLAVDPRDGRPHVLVLDGAFRLRALDLEAETDTVLAHDVNSAAITASDDGALHAAWINSAGQLMLATRDPDSEDWGLPRRLTDGLHDVISLQHTLADGPDLYILAGTNAISIEGISVVCAYAPDLAWRCEPPRRWPVGARSEAFVKTGDGVALAVIDETNTLRLHPLTF